MLKTRILKPMNLQLIICLKPVQAQLNKRNTNIKTSIKRAQTITTLAVCLSVCFTAFTSPISSVLSILQLWVL